MPNTITTYNTFSGGTKARATQVNQNFNNYRGTLLPINEDSASASTNTHDLGSADHRWNDVYANTINLRGATSTVDFKVVPDTSVTAGSVNLLLGGTTVGAFGPTGFDGAFLQTASVSYSSIQNGGGTSTAQWSFSATGVTLQTIAASVLSITSYGRPVLISVQGDDTSSAMAIFPDTTATAIGIYIHLVRNGTVVASEAREIDRGGPGTSTGYSLYFGSIQFVDTPSSGAQTYYLLVRGFNSASRISLFRQVMKICEL